jgi:hypothetical protein
MKEKYKREKAPLFCLVGEKGELYLEEREKERECVRKTEGGTHFLT